MTPSLPSASSHSALAGALERAASAAASLDETIRCLRTLDAHVGRLSASADHPRPVVLPAYGGTRGAVNLTPLLALLLRHYDVPVLVHGFARSSPGCIGTIDVLAELGVEAAYDLDDAQSRLAREGLAYVALDALAPAFAALLASDVQSSARALAPLIDPFGGDSYRVVGVARAEALTRMRELLAATHANALLFIGTDGEPFVDPWRQSQLEHFGNGMQSICAEAQSETRVEPVAFAGAVDLQTTAGWTERALFGEVPVPLPLLTELGCCLAGARRSGGESATRSY